MAKFKDADGREWELRIRLPDVQRLATAGCDLDRIAAEPSGVVGVLGLGPHATGAALWVLCEKQADARNLTPDQFAEGFDGPALEAARTGLLEAVLDFFRVPGTDQIKARLPRLLAEIGRQSGERMDRLLGELNASDGGSPAKSESTPAS